MMEPPFDPYHRWLGIPPSQQPADCYRLLALERFESDPDVIDEAAERQIAHVRRKALGAQAELSQRILNELADARAVLLDPARKAAYDARLRAAGGAAGPPAPAAERQSPVVRWSGAQPVGVPATVAAADASSCRTQGSRAARNESPVPAVAITESARAGGRFVQPKRRGGPDRTLYAALAGVGGVVLLTCLCLWFLLTSEEPLPRPTRAQAKPASVQPPPTATPEPQPAHGVAIGRIIGDHAAQAFEQTPQPVPEEVPDDPDIESAMAGDSAVAGDVRSAAKSEPSAEQAEPTGSIELPPLEPPVSATGARSLVPEAAQRAETLSWMRQAGLVPKDANRPSDNFRSIDRLIRQAGEDQPADRRYWLWHEARRLAIEQGDAASALLASQRISEHFDADPVAELRTALAGVRSKVRHRDERRQFVTAALSAYRRAAGEGQYEAAEQFVDWAVDAASPSAGAEWLEAARQHQADLATVKDDILAARSAEQVLRTDPENPRANRLYGRYLLCYTAEAEEGLARLTHGDDAALKSLAERELLGSAAPAETLYELAEAWWQWSAAAGALARRNVRQRLRPWYDKARTELTGTVRSTAEGRLEELDQLAAIEAPPFQPRFDVIWVPAAPGVRWDVFADLPPREFDRALEDRKRDGGRPLCVSGYLDETGQTRFVGVWIHDGTPYVCYHSRRTVDLQGIYEATKRDYQGYQVLWRDTHRAGNGNLNIWIYGKPAKSVGWGWWRCSTVAELQEQTTRQQQDGKRVAILSIFEAESRHEYHIEWLLDGLEAQYDLDFSLEDLEAKIAQRRGQWWLSFVDAYGRGTERKYSAVWVRAAADMRWEASLALPAFAFQRELTYQKARSWRPHVIAAQ